MLYLGATIPHLWLLFHIGYGTIVLLKWETHMKQAHNDEIPEWDEPLI